MMGGAEERELLDRFGLVSEQEVAALLGITVKALKNRPLDRKPAYFQSGRRRLFIEESVREFLGLPPLPKVKHAPPLHAPPSVDPELKKAIDEAARAAGLLSDKLLKLQAILKEDTVDMGPSHPLRGGPESETRK
jgi:hypothetical protein